MELDKNKNSEIKYLINDIYETFDILKMLRDKTKDDLSKIDRELSNHYHSIEGADVKFMTDSHKMIIKLKDILNQRRDIKVNYTLLESFITTLDKTMDKTKKRTTEIIKKHENVIQEIIDRSIY